MRLTVLGSCGGWPEAGAACSGYLLEHDGFRLVLDIGYAVVPRLFELVDADDVDAVLISHGHPDHCADLNPLLRARALRDDPAPPLPVYAPPGALDAVLALDRPGVLDAAYERHDLDLGGQLEIGPFEVTTRGLPHTWPNAGMRLTAGGRVLAYTGDCGPSSALADLARDADLLLAEASFADDVPGDERPHLSSAEQRGRDAAAAGARRLLLTHLLPGTDALAARAAAARTHGSAVDVAVPGLVVDLDQIV